MAIDEVPVETPADPLAPPTPDDNARTVALRLPAEPAAVAQARRFVAARWAWLDDSTLDDVELVVSELVSNAVRHGQPEIDLRLRVEPFALDIAVLDHGDGVIPTEAQLSDTTARSGRGLAIVDRLANSWGVEPLAGETGKEVWASLSRGPDHRAVLGQEEQTEPPAR